MMLIASNSKFDFSKLDTSNTIRINRSKSKIWFSLFLLIIFFVSGFFLLTFNIEEFSEFSLRLKKAWFIGIIGWVFLILLIPITIFALINTTFGRGRHVIVAPSGLRDTRNFDGEIPWSAISGLSNQKILGTSKSYLNVSQEYLRRPKQNFITEMAYKLNYQVGSKGIHIRADDLHISTQELRQILIEYAKAHNPEFRLPKEFI